MLLDLLSNAITSYSSTHFLSVTPTWLVCLQFCKGPQLALVNHPNSIATKVYVEVGGGPKSRVLDSAEDPFGLGHRSQSTEGQINSPRHNYKVGNLRFKGRSKFPTCFQICPLNFCSTTKCTSHIARALHVKQLLHIELLFHSQVQNFRSPNPPIFFSLSITFFSSHLHTSIFNTLCILVN